MKQHAKVAHQMPGRIRITVPAAKGNPELLDKVRAMLADIPGMKASRAKPDAGSIVLNYDVKREAEFQEHFVKRWHQAAAAMPHAVHHKAPRIRADRLPGGEIGEVAHKIEVEAEFLAGHSHTARMIVDLFKDADQALKRATDNNVDLKIVLAVALAVATFVQIGAHAATPMWVTLALFAVNHFIEMHQAHPGVAAHAAPPPSPPPAAAPAPAAA